MPLVKVIRRDGTVVPYDRERIANAIWKAAQAVGGKDRKRAERLAEEVEAYLIEQGFGPENPPHIEQIQDAVEKILIERGHARTAKAFILYRRQREELRRVGVEVQVTKLVDDYLNLRDWRVKENSNMGFSLSGLLFHIGTSVIAKYTLMKVYPPEIAAAHVHGDFHIHDLGFGISGYCAGWSLQQLLLEGFNGVPGKVSSKPPKHLDTALLQMSNFVGSLQNEWAGAQAFNAVDVLLAPFVRTDGLSYREVKQKIQQFVYNLNISSRWGGQTPFTNISLSLTVPDDLAGTPAIVGGRPLDKTYEEFGEEVELIDRAFIEVMTEGDAQGRPFTFPIPTFGLTRDFEWDNGISSLLFEMTAKYGLPYFQNFINSHLSPSDVRSMCCHLSLRLDELRRNVTGGLFGSGDKTGSVGVVTINMPRIGYLSEDESEFFEKLEHLMNLAKVSLEIKRKEVTRKMNSGLLPYTKRYLGTLDFHFSTIGLVGMHEACLNMGIEGGIVGQEGRNFALKVLRFMLRKIREFQQETGHLYNLEATPAEGTSYRLARIDKQKYPSILTSGERAPYYTNSTCLPVNADLDLWDAIRHQEPLQTLYTGGTVFHTYLGERLEDGESCKNLIRKMAERSRLPYFTVTPTFSICPDHGYLPGEYPLCPSCGAETEVYSRVVGYFRPVKNWNEGKQEEFRQRRTFERG
ncbi:MAG: ribonucleoside triphosphate reductase [Candidatus Hadarchaeales archaeon]